MKASSQAVPLKCCRWAGAVLELLLGKHMLMEAGEGSCRGVRKLLTHSHSPQQREEEQRGKEKPLPRGVPGRELGVGAVCVLGELPVLHLTLLRGKMVQSGSDPAHLHL